MRQDTPPISLAVLLAPLVLSGCASSPAAPPPAPVVDPPAAAPPAHASASSAASAPASAGPVPDAAQPCSEAQLAPLRAELRAALASGNKARTRTAVDKLVELRGDEPETRRLRARLLLDVDDLPEAAVESEVLLRLLDSKDALAWLILGLQAEHLGQTESARAAFARSTYLDPASEASRKLARASRCTSEVHPLDDKLMLPSSWAGVWKALEAMRESPSQAAPPRSEAAAKAKVCSRKGADGASNVDLCQGAGPWDVDIEETKGGQLRALILPLSGKRFAVAEHMLVPAGPCDTSPKLTITPRGKVIEVAVENKLKNGSLGACGETAATECLARPWRTVQFYDAATGRGLLALEDDRAREQLDIQGWKLRRSGIDGCDETLVLNAFAPAAGKAPP